MVVGRWWYAVDGLLLVACGSRWWFVTVDGGCWWFVAVGVGG